MMWLPQSRGFSEVVLAICIEPARAQPCIMLARTQPQSSRLRMADYPGVGSRTGRTEMDVQLLCADTSRNVVFDHGASSSLCGGALKIGPDWPSSGEY